MPTDLDAIPTLTQAQVDALRARATFLCSHPKCGRTWARFLLAAYLNRVLSLDVDLDLRTVFRIVPNDAASIARFEAMGKMRKANAFAFADHAGVPVVLGTHARCKPALLKRPIILLVRSIPDTLSSLHAQRVQGAIDVPGDLRDYLAMDPSPLDALIDYYNGWGDGLARARRPALVTSYERLSASAHAVLAQLAAFLSLPVVEDQIAGAVEDASLDAMRRLERDRGAGWRDSDEDARTRVRRGRVGGSRDDLTPGDLARIAERCDRRLTPAAKGVLTGAGVSLAPPA